MNPAKVTGTRPIYTGVWGRFIIMQGGYKNTTMTPRWQTIITVPTRGIQREYRGKKLCLYSWVPGQAPGGGPISSFVVQTVVSDYSHTVRAPQSRAFLQAVSRPCPKTIKCRGLQMSTVVDWGDGCLLMTAMFWGNLLSLLVS